MSGQVRAGELIVVEVRIDHRIRHWQIRAGQMVIGNQHLDAETMCFFDAIHALYAIIDGNQQVRRTLCGYSHDFR